MFEREDWMLFRSIDSLGQKAGVGRDRLAAVVVKELVDNALDAGARASVTFEQLPGGAGVFTVSDDGPGIEGSDEEIARLFSFRRGLLSTKLLRLPTRGALGNGLRVVMGAVSCSGGGIEVETRGRALTLSSQPDGTTLVLERNPSAVSGTRVRIRLGPVLQPEKSDLMLAQNAIALAEMEGTSRFTGLSSPWWYSVDAFYELCQGWSGSARDLAVKLHRRGASVAAEVPTRSLTKEQAKDILRDLQGLGSAPKASVLGVCGPSLRIDGKTTGYAKRAGYYPQSAAPGTAIPYVVEVWAAPSDDPSIMWFANRTPTAAPGRIGRGDRGKWWVNGCGLNHYVQIGKRTVALFVCVTSPWIPITTDGKEPNFEPIFDDIDSAIRGACRLVAKVDSGGTQTEVVGSVIDEAVRHASDDGAHRYSLRQLYYSTRGILTARGVETPAYGYFSSIVTEIEAARKSDLPGIYRDARGVLYHPHTREQIPLGTLGVEAYRQRRYAFHRVLYIEKGGFLPLLLDAKWPERHDCAILTSQGFASRAARDVIDLLGDGDEPIQFFCVHDADGPGTLIYEKLQEETAARGARRVEIHNLGLDPWEAKEMDLQPETFERKRGKVPVARYVRQRWSGHPETSQTWASWLQTSRFELNAMTSGQFLAWLDRKIAPFEARGAGSKLVPPDPVLTEAYLDTMRKQIHRNLVEEAAAAARVHERVNEILDYPLAKFPLSYGRLQTEVRAHLSANPGDSWEDAIAKVSARYSKDLTNL